MAIRILLGVFVLFFGLNKFMQFMEFPPIEGDGGTLMGIYISSGFMKLIGVLEIVFGILLIIGKFIPLSTVVIGAIMFNAAVFHGIHHMEGIGGAAIGCVLSLLTLIAYKGQFKGLLSA